MKETKLINESNIGELLTAYYQGTLASEEAKTLEQFSHENEFVEEAMEGFDEFPEAVNQIPAFKPKSKIGYKWIMAIGGIALLITAAYFIQDYTPKEDNSGMLAITVTKPLIDSELEPLEKVIAKVESEKSIKPQDTKALIPKTVKENKSPEATKEVIKKREVFEIPRMELNPIELEEKATYTLKRARTKAIGFYTFLAVDYSKIYNNSIPVLPTYSGTDASFANKNNLSVEMSDGKTQSTVSYKTFLKQSLFLMKNKEYDKSISNFKVILTNFPGDVNAEFYIGYAKFYQGKYEEAIPYFNKAMNNAFDFFMEDAEWFKANSLQKLGKLKKAQIIYNSIKKKGGYYSYQVN